MKGLTVTEARYAYDDLLRFARVLLERAGLDTDKARAVADILVEADLLGHDTHGLNLLAAYLKELETGGMTKSGQPRVVHDKPAALTWDGKRLPGPWLVLKAIETAIPRARELGTCSVVISRSHHIACLASYLQRVADQGLMILLTTSAPDNAAVAPHGGRRGVMTPNPIAAGWPTGGDPGAARCFHVARHQPDDRPPAARRQALSGPVGDRCGRQSHR